MFRNLKHYDDAATESTGGEVVNEVTTVEQPVTEVSEPAPTAEPTVETPETVDEQPSTAEAPVAEPTPTVEPAPSVEETPVTETTDTVETTLSTEPTTTVEEPTPTAEPTDEVAYTVTDPILTDTPVETTDVTTEQSPVLHDFDKLIQDLGTAIDNKIHLVSRLKTFANGLKTLEEDVVEKVEESAPVTAIEKLYAKVKAFEQSNNSFSKIVAHLESII